MKKLLLLCVLGFWAGVTTTQAQTAEQPVGFKILFGAQSYNGDLGNEVLEFAEEDYVYGLGLAYYVNRYLDLSLEARWMKLDRINGPDEVEFQRRNTFFETNLFNVNLLARFKPFVSRLNPYIAAGVGTGIYQDASNVRKDDSYVLLSIPFGVGVNYQLKENIMLNIQTIYNRTFNDKIDNYPLTASEAAPGISVPRPNFDDKDHDDYFTLTLGVIYNFGGEMFGEDHKADRLYEQSMDNLQTAEALNRESLETLQKAQALNDETLAALEALQEDRGMSDEQMNAMRAEFVRILNNIQFEYDEATIIDPAIDELESLAMVMKEYKNLDILIEAYADERGSVGYNEELANRRAQSVKDFLASRGVNPARITTSIYGESQALMEGSSPTAYAQNRAVQITLSYDGDYFESSKL